MQTKNKKSSAPVIMLFIKGSLRVRCCVKKSACNIFCLAFATEFFGQWSIGPNFASSSPPPAARRARGKRPPYYHTFLHTLQLEGGGGGGQRGKKLTSPSSPVFFATRVTYEEREWQKKAIPREMPGRKRFPGGGERKDNSPFYPWG